MAMFNPNLGSTDFAMDSIDWGSDSDEDVAAAYSSTLLGRDETGRQPQPRRSEATIQKATASWDELTTGAQWIVLEVVRQDCLDEKGKGRGFTSIVTTVLHLSRAQIQSFLTTYITQYEAWEQWEKHAATIDWDKLRQLAANANRSIFDLLPQGRPKLSTDRISKQEVEVAAAFLRSRHLDHLSETLHDWVGLNVTGDFLGLCIEAELLQDCLDARLLQKAHRLGWIDLNAVERQYRDICDNGKVQSRVPPEIFERMKNNAVRPDEVASKSVPASQAKKGRRQPAATDKKAGRGGRQPQNSNKQNKNARAAGADDASSSNPAAKAGEPKTRTQPQDCREADEPPSKDVITVSRTSSVNFVPDDSPVASNTVVEPTRKQGLAPSPFKRLSANPGNAGNINTHLSPGQGRSTALSDGYKSLKVGVVQDRQLPAMLNWERKSIHEVCDGSLGQALPIRPTPPRSTGLTPERSCGTRQPQPATEHPQHSRLDRAATFNKIAASSHDQTHPTAATQLREALDTRYVNYLESPRPPTPGQRERRPSRRMMDSTFIDAAAAPDSDGDDDYMPENEKAPKRKTQYSSRNVQPENNELRVPCRGQDGNKRRINMPPPLSTSTPGSTNQGPYENSNHNKKSSISGVGIPSRQLSDGATTLQNTAQEKRSSASRKDQPIFGQYRNRVLTTQPGRLETADYAWSASQAIFASTAVKARFALTADRPIDGNSKTLDEVALREILERRGHFMAAERATQGDVGQDAECALYAGCADFATYAEDAEEAEFATHFRDDEPGGHYDGSGEGEEVMEGIEGSTTNPGMES